MCIANVAAQYLICITNDKRHIANCDAIQLNLSTEIVHNAFLGTASVYFANWLI